MASVPALAPALLTALTLLSGLGCGDRKASREHGAASSAPSRSTAASVPSPPVRPALTALEPGEVYVYGYGEDHLAEGPGGSAAPARISAAEARVSHRLVVDLSDGWAPFIFQDGGVDLDGAGGANGADPVKPNAYRQTFVDLAGDRVSSDGQRLEAGGVGKPNFLEPFGIPPTLTVLKIRAEHDASPQVRACEAGVDLEALRLFTGNVAYQDREQARREFLEASRDATWLDSELATRREAAARGEGPGEPEPRLAARLERAERRRDRLRAIRAVQQRLLCEGLLSAHDKLTSGTFDLPTHEALAAWERKNDIFGWGAIGGETLSALQRPALELDLETFRRILAERVADAAGIVEDGSTAKWKTPPSYLDPHAGSVRRPVPDLIAEHVSALLASLAVKDPSDMLELLRQHDAAGLAKLQVAFIPPPLPPYYGPGMKLSVEIDRGDVWYDLPFDARGRPVEQHRDNFPHLTLFVHWQGQDIPLCWWRTTIGSWRSELHANGKIYYKYKNSDVGPRLWRQIVAGPVWIPPETTPAKDLLILKVLDRNKGPELVVNTDVMGPGFQSAYGLVMAVHVDRNGFDNQIRTHGSVDYTSIARRFSHGCHRLVNNRAVRLFDFVLRRQPFRRIGAVPLSLERQLVVDGKTFAFELATRGYYYQLLEPIPVMVQEGRIMGAIKAPITAYLRKAGIDYSGVATKVESAVEDTTGSSPDSAASLGIPDEPGIQVVP